MQPHKEDSIKTAKPLFYKVICLSCSNRNHWTTRHIIFTKDLCRRFVRKHFVEFFYSKAIKENFSVVEQMLLLGETANDVEFTLVIV